MNSLRVLYLADRFDGPYRYRCLHACEQLRRGRSPRQRDACSDDPGVLDGARGLLGGRPLSIALERQGRSDRRARAAAGIPLVFDVDDLVFDPACADAMPFRAAIRARLGSEPTASTLRALRRTLEACDLALVSTPASGRTRRASGQAGARTPEPRLAALPEMARRTTGAPARCCGRRRRSATSPGSDTHDADFAAIAEPLRQRALGAPRRAAAGLSAISTTTSAALAESRRGSFGYRT